MLMHNDNQPPERPRSYVPPSTRPYAPSLPSRPVFPVASTGIAAPQTQPSNPGVSPDATQADKQKRPLFLLPSHVPTHKKKKRLIILIAAGLVVIAGGGGGAYAFMRQYAPSVTPAVKAKKYIPPQPKVVASTLSGLPVDPSVNARPVTAVMVENSPDARPQSGLDQAGVVFEAIAEGGVTRFMALYQDTQPNYIGPVRSARSYYLQWMLGFDAAYAHVGGSPDALQDITSWHVKDLNQFYNAGAYERISSRAAPHNVYTSIAQLNQIETTKGYTTSSFTGFPRKAAAPSKTPNATSIDVTLSGYYYNAHYDYDAATNSYKRSEAAAAHMELNKDGSTVQLSPKVVVTMVVPLTSGALDSSGAYYSNYAVIGSGKVFVFQDGVVQTGTWTKSSNTAQIVFTDANGQPLKLDPGQTWITAISGANDVTYK